MSLKALPGRAIKAARRIFNSAFRRTETEAVIQRYLAFNRRKWPTKGKANQNSVILAGLVPSYASMFCYSYFLNYLANKLDARIESYQFIGTPNQNIKSIFESFGAQFCLGADCFNAQKEQVAAEVAAVFPQLKTKWDVLNLSIDGVLVGDKIYDSYLRFYNEATVNLQDDRFKDIVSQAFHIFHAARSYLQRTKVAGFITDDFSYLNSGIITRLMFEHKVPVYMVLFGKPFIILQLDANPPAVGLNPFPPLGYCRYYSYPQLFKHLTRDEQERGRNMGRQTLEARLSGKFCPLVRMPGTTYGESSQRILEEGAEPRILVMLHDFIDSPHGYREMLFPDFYEWIVFLLERAEKTPFRWYVKPHPAAADPSRKALNKANDHVVEDLRARFPGVTFLPETASNQQILADGISAMFTVHGTAGHEFAYHGVPVVNCGDNPHIAYDFNIHAASLEEYERCIREADRLTVQTDRRAIEEFVYMHYFHLADHLGSPVNPIDEQILDRPDGLARLEQAAVLDQLMAAATPERERGVEAYFDSFFSRPHFMQSNSNS